MLLPALAALGTIGQGILGFVGQKQVNDTNLRIAREAQIYDRKMWDLQNQYNSPEAQMQRMTQAGLNPRLIYGSSASQVSGVNSSRPQAYTAKVENTLDKLRLPDVMGVLNMYQEYKNNRAIEENIKAETMNKNKQGLLQDLEAIIKGTQGEISKQDLNLKQVASRIASAIEENKIEMSGVELASKKQGIRYKEEAMKTMAQNRKQSRAKTDILELEKQFKDLYLQKEKTLEGTNMTMSDELWQRLIALIIDKLGINIFKND